MSNADVKTQIVLIHGNPGRGSDFDALARMLPRSKGSELLRYERPEAVHSLNDLLAPLDALPLSKDAPIVVIAYSFGCWLSLKWLEKCVKKADLVVFVNPTLATDAVPAALRFLTSIPLLSDALLAKLSPKLAGGFAKKCFAPESVDETVETALVQGLTGGSIWKAALAAKAVQHADPLRANLAGLAQRFAILRGHRDQAVSWPEQENALLHSGILQANTQLYDFPEAGHGLLWSRPAEVAAVIVQEFGSIPL